ncbi:MAG: hypothetical protein ABIH41_02970 [Nanoarchaeota archaeon]
MGAQLYTRSITVCLLVLFLFVQGTSAIGLRGVTLKDEIFFQPGIVREYDFLLYANAGFTQDYEFYVRMFEGDDLTQYVTLDKTYVEDVGSGGNVPFHATLRLPDKIEHPGIHDIRIGVRETEVAGGGAIGAKTGSEARVIIYVLYPDPYLISQFNARSFNVDEAGDFTFQISNFGEPSVIVNGVVDIYDADDKHVTTVRSENQRIEPTKKVQLPVRLDTKGMVPGLYRAEADLFWAANVTNFTTYFKVGDLSVKVVNHTKEVKADAISSFIISIESGWNNRIKDIYGIVTVRDAQGGKLKEFKTVNTDLDPWQPKELQGYFDADGLAPGTYPIDITLFYEGLQTVEHGEVLVSEDAQVETFEEIPGQPSLLSMQTLLIIVVCLLVAILVALAVLVIRRR